MGSEIVFLAQRDLDSWVMKINDKGIHFNKKRYPDTDPTGFANAVMEILENHFEVKFSKKNVLHASTVNDACGNDVTGNGM